MKAIIAFFIKKNVDAVLNWIASLIGKVVEVVKENKDLKETQTDRDKQAAIVEELVREIQRLQGFQQPDSQAITNLKQRLKDESRKLRNM